MRSLKLPKASQNQSGAAWHRYTWPLQKATCLRLTEKTFGCPSGGIGLGFKLPFRPKLAEFLSTGSPEQMGEHYWKTPELAQAFIDQLPVTNVPEEFVVFSPLSKAPCEPTVVSIYVNPDQLSALVVLASYARKTNENIIVPMGAGCHTSVLYALKECDNESPRARAWDDRHYG